MEAFLEGWKSGAAAVQSVFRKYEYDWTIVSILDSSYSMMWRHQVASWLTCLTLDQVGKVESCQVTLCCVLGEDTSLSQCLSTQVYKIMGTGKLNAWGVT